MRQSIATQHSIHLRVDGMHVYVQTLAGRLIGVNEDEYGAYGLAILALAVVTA